jgi:hypothetical protein
LVYPKAPPLARSKQKSIFQSVDTMRQIVYRRLPNLLSIIVLFLFCFYDWKRRRSNINKRASANTVYEFCCSHSLLAFWPSCQSFSFVNWKAAKDNCKKKQQLAAICPDIKIIGAARRQIIISVFRKAPL